MNNIFYTLPVTVTLALFLTVFAPPLCLLEATHVYKADLVTLILRTDCITSPTKVSSTEAPETWTYNGEKKIEYRSLLQVIMGMNVFHFQLSVMLLNSLSDYLKAKHEYSCLNSVLIFVWSVQS